MAVTEEHGDGARPPNEFEAPDELLEIDCRAEDGEWIVALRGELDLAGAPAVRAELDRAGNTDGALTVVDLHELTFIDSTGLAILFDAFERADGTGRRIVFTRSSHAVERTLRVTGLDRILPIDTWRSPR